MILARCRRNRHNAFTLVELLVVIAIIALLVSILLPSLAKAREEAKKVKCLANMRDIALSSIGYANDDPSGYMIPVLPTLRDGSYVSASRRAFGGKSGTHRFDSSQYAEHQTWYGGTYGMWSTKNGFGPGQRPLNRFIYKNLGEARSLDAIAALDESVAIAEEQTDFSVFQCPSDTGFNSALDGDSDDVIFGYGGSTPQQRGYKLDLPLYDAMGNSYATDAVLTTGGDNGGSVAWGPYFRKYSMIPNPSKVTAYVEGKGFYACFWNDRAFGDEVAYTMGNHGTLREHQVSFADGHAGAVLYEVRDDAVITTGNRVEHSGNFTLRGGTVLSLEYNLPPGDDLGAWDHLLVGGPGWQNHCQPSPPVQSESVTW